MKPHTANHIDYNNARHLYNGAGQTKGSLLFVNTANGRCLELHEAVIIETTKNHDIACAPGHAGLARVRVEKDALKGKASCPQIGTRLLIGPIQYGAVPRALAAWPLEHPAQRPYAEPVLRARPAPQARPTPAPKPAPRPLPTRFNGKIVRTNVNFGFIRAVDGSQEELFFHRTALLPGTPMLVGLPVVFSLGKNERGIVAQEIRLAA